MSTWPPPYPRIPHLVPGRGTRDDLLLGADAAGSLVAGPVIVEEKLDGANVVIWRDQLGRTDVALRGGPGSMDRAGQRGPLRAWVAEHGETLKPVLDAWPVVYAEWLLLTHSIAYHRLPSYVVVLDLWREPDTFAGPDERTAICVDAGLTTPPELWRGRPGSLEQLERRIGTSTWGEAAMEGVVVRRLEPGEPRLAKLVRADLDRLSDEEWRSGRPRNRLTAGEASWR